MFDFAVFIGRFQPFHLGHKQIVDGALEKAKELIMVIGSFEKARDTRNPLSAQERVDIIRASLPKETFNRIRFTFVPDYPYNLDKWIADVQGAVFHSIHSKGFLAGPYSVALAGMKKDSSSFYLNLFPTWDSIAISVTKDVISATEIRNFYYQKYEVNENIMPGYGADKFIEHMDKVVNELTSDYEYEEQYMGKWGKGPHMTVDSCIVQAGHLLLIQRGKEYGYKKWALPGGFINPDETTLDATLRELDEETKIKVPQKVLRGSIKQRILFDDPYRSNRARIITHATHFRLDDVGALPKVKGSDDAMDARWFPIAQVKNMRSQLFEDHFDVISTLLEI
jgi:bifunctional NMN adenylyltransferase/nudix hydrolase